MLIKLAEILEVPVSRLLGSKIETAEQPDALAEQLSRINEQLAIKNRRAKRVRKAIAFIVGGIIIAVVMAIFNVQNIFIPALNLLGTFVPPLGGAMIGDFLFVYKCKLPRLEYVNFKTCRWGPVIAYIIGCICAYLGGKYNIGIASLEGIIIAMLLVPVIHKILVKLGVNDDHEVAADAEYV